MKITVCSASEIMKQELSLPFAVLKLTNNTLSALMISGFLYLNGWKHVEPCKQRNRNNLKHRHTLFVGKCPSFPNKPPPRMLRF